MKPGFYTIRRSTIARVDEAGQVIDFATGAVVPMEDYEIDRGPYTLDELLAALARLRRGQDRRP